MTRDLFADEDDLNGIYLTDRTLVDQLALSKLQETAASLTAQGWAWAEVTLDTEPVSNRYGRVYPEPVDLTPEQQAEMEAYAKAGTPGPEHKALAAMVGDYDLKSLVRINAVLDETPEIADPHDARPLPPLAAPVH